MNDKQHTGDQPEPRQQRFALSWEEATLTEQAAELSVAGADVPQAEVIPETEASAREVASMQHQAPDSNSQFAGSSEPVNDTAGAETPPPKKLLLKKKAPQAEAVEAASPPDQPAVAQRTQASGEAPSEPPGKVIQAVDSQTIKLATKASTPKTSELKPSSVETPSNGLGAMLQEAREARGLEIVAVAEDTRINSEYIVALESEDFDNLPLAAIYIKSYLKTLARRYSLAPETLIEMYEERQSENGAASEGAAAASAKHAQAEHASDSAAAAEASDAVRFKRFAWAMAAVVALVIGILGAAVVKSRFFTPGPVSEADLTVLTSEDLQRFTPPETLPFSELELPPKSQAAADSR